MHITFGEHWPIVLEAQGTMQEPLRPIAISHQSRGAEDFNTMCFSLKEMYQNDLVIES